MPWPPQPSEYLDLVDTVASLQATVAELEEGGGGWFNAYAYLRDEKASGTFAGASVTGSWLTRDLNTVVSDEDDIVSLASNEFTLGAGSYYIRARSPARLAGNYKTKLRNVTDSSDALIGSNAQADSDPNNPQADSWIVGPLTVVGTKAFAVQYQCSNAQATHGLGVANAFGVVEVYTEVEIWRKA